MEDAQTYEPPDLLFSVHRVVKTYHKRKEIGGLFGKIKQKESAQIV